MVVGASHDGPEQDALARALALALPAPFTLITEADDDGSHLVGAHATRWPIGSSRTALAATALCRQIVHTARPVIVHDLRRRALADGDALAALGITGYAGVPIMDGDHAVGAVSALVDRARSWSDHDVEILRCFADAAASARRRERAFVRERAIGALLIATATTTRISDAIEALARQVGSRASLVTIEHGRVRTLASHDADHPDRPLSASVWPLDVDPLVRDALLSGAPIWHRDLGGRGDVTTAFAVAIPDSSAVLQLFARKDQPEPADLAPIAQAVAALLASVLRRVTPSSRRDRRTGELEVFALHDELTGLLNRRGFNAVATSQLQIARRKAMPGILLYIDVDDLKQVNDRDGHSAGDALLRLAATVLRATFRDSDTIARLGGDEFVVFAIDATDRDLAAVGDRLARELEHANAGLAQPSRLRWSVGQLPFECSGPCNLDTLIIEADRRMYLTKRDRKDVDMQQDARAGTP